MDATLDFINAYGPVLVAAISILVVVAVMMSNWLLLARNIEWQLDTPAMPTISRRDQLGFWLRDVTRPGARPRRVNRAKIIRRIRERRETRIAA